MVYNNNYCSIEDAWGNLVPKKKKKRSKDPICELYDMSTSSNYDELEMLQAANSIEFDRYNKAKYQKDRQASREKPKYVQIDATEDREYVPLYKQKSSEDSELDQQFASSMQGAQCSKTNIKMPDFESHFNPLTEQDDETRETFDAESEVDYKEFKHILDKNKPTPADVQEPYSDNEDDDEPPQRRPMRKIRDVDVNESFMDSIYNGKTTGKASSMAFLDLLLYIVSGMILIFVMEQFVKIGVMLQQ
jgi:hypothetical protein